MNDAFNKFLEQLSKLGFGFALGAGLGGFAFIIVSSFMKLDVSPIVFLYSGGAFGLGFNRLFDRFLKPLTSFLQFYFKLIELYFMKRAGFINEKESNKIMKGMVFHRFVGEDPELLKSMESMNNMLEDSENEELDLNKLRQNKEKIAVEKIKKN